MLLLSRIVVEHDTVRVSSDDPKFPIENAPTKPTA